MEVAFAYWPLVGEWVDCWVTPRTEARDWKVLNRKLKIHKHKTLVFTLGFLFFIKNMDILRGKKKNRKKKKTVSQLRPHKYECTQVGSRAEQAHLNLKVSVRKQHACI